MKKSGINVIEFTLIAVLAVFVTIAFWNKISDMAINLTGLSSVKTANAGSVMDRVKSALSNLNKNSSNYLDKRVETAGMLGQLIAQYKESKDSDLYNEICDLLRSLAGKDGNKLSDNDVGSCISSPSSCSTLMTITKFSWSSSVNMNNTYGGGKIPATLNYNYSYVNDKGILVNSTLKQNVEIQKEQNESKEGQKYSSFLNNYMDTKYSNSAFTGSAVNVQAQINDYLSGTNCELSKSDSEYVNFSGHSVYSK